MIKMFRYYITHINTHQGFVCKLKKMDSPCLKLNRADEHLGKHSFAKSVSSVAICDSDPKQSWFKPSFFIFHYPSPPRKSKCHLMIRMGILMFRGIWCQGLTQTFINRDAVHYPTV